MATSTDEIPQLNFSELLSIPVNIEKILDALDEIKSQICDEVYVKFKSRQHAASLIETKIEDFAKKCFQAIKFIYSLTKKESQVDKLYGQSVSYSRMNQRHSENELKLDRKSPSPQHLTMNDDPASKYGSSDNLNINVNLYKELVNKLKSKFNIK